MSEVERALHEVRDMYEYPRIYIHPHTHKHTHTHAQTYTRTHILITSAYVHMYVCFYSTQLHAAERALKEARDSLDVTTVACTEKLRHEEGIRKEAEIRDAASIVQV